MQFFYQNLVMLHYSIDGGYFTWDAREKFGPGDLFLFGAGCALLAAPPEFDPLRFRRLFAGL